MNLLENHLRSWRPRRPCPRLKRRLFGRPAVTREAISLSLRWMAPAAACLLLVVTMARQGSGFRSSGTGPMLGLISSNLSYTNLLPHNRSSGHNRVFPASFEWTNDGTFTSNVSPFSPTGID